MPTIAIILLKQQTIEKNLAYDMPMKLVEPEALIVLDADPREWS